MRKGASTHMHATKNDAGFTLIEMLVAMGIGMVMIAAVTTTFNSQTRFYNAQEQINDMQQNARGALDVISRELKLAGYKSGTGTVTGLTASGVNLDSSNLVIQADLNQDNQITVASSASDPDKLEQVTYSFSSTNKRIQRRLGSLASDIFADNITSFTFEYLTSTGATATLASNIRQIRITITAQTAKPDPNYTVNGGYHTYTVSETITPPNLSL